MNKLTEICAEKRSHVRKRRANITSSAMHDQLRIQSPPRGFVKAIEEKTATGFALIAEIKKASPSKGLIREDFDPPTHARAYEAGGAACLSILTDMPFFQGADEYLVAAQAACTLPCLRKDFMIDPWQVEESRALGADAILIIMAALDDSLAGEIEATAHELGMDVLVEVHDEIELERALRLKSRLLGINNRNLKTFETTLDTTRELSKRAPADRLLISESGLNSPADLADMAGFGARTFLIGESLMRQDDVEAATKALLANPVPVREVANG